MTKNQISRRGFLKGLGQTAIAGALASILKFVPEAQDVLAGEKRPNREVTITPLSPSQIDELASQAYNDTDSQALITFLESRQFVEDTVARSGSRLQISAKGATVDVSVLFVSCVNQELSGALFGYVVGTTSQADQIKMPMVVISEEAAYVAQNGQATVLENPPEALKLLIKIPIKKSLKESGSSKVLAKPALPTHCCSQTSNCIVASFTCSVLTICCGAGGLCCVAAIGACATAAGLCIFALNCCNNSPHGCGGC